MQRFDDTCDYIEFIKRTMKTDAYKNVFRKEFEKQREWSLMQERNVTETITKLNEEEDKLVRSKVIARKTLKRKGFNDYDVDKILRLDNFGCVVIMSKEAIEKMLTQL